MTVTPVAPAEAAVVAPVVAPVVEATPEVTPEVAVETPEVTPEVAPTETPEVPAEEAQETPSELPVDFTAYNEQFEADGKLSEENYTKLAAEGYPKELVDTYIAGQQATVSEDLNTSLITSIGGEEAYGELTTWAAQNLPSADVAKYNAAISNANTAEFALEWLQGKREAVEGKPAAVTLEGNNAPTPTRDVFTSTSQVTAAMKDPRYKRDTAYQAEVQAKMARSNVF